MIAKAVAMGDEFHQRNIAASLVFLKELVPVIETLDMPEKDGYDVLKFLSDTDQFFLNIMMATGKAVMDGARTIKEGTGVTAMCRNGKDFDIRISGMIQNPMDRMACECRSYRDCLWRRNSCELPLKIQEYGTAVPKEIEIVRRM